MMDNDIQKLLFEAEERLEAFNALDTNSSPSEKKQKAKLPNIPKLSSSALLAPYFHQKNELAVIDSSRVTQKLHERDGISGLSAEKPKQSKKGKPTAGNDWFHLPKTELTSELKRDLQLLRMRSILDPKRHYKKENGKALPPKFSQVGTIIEGPTEFFSGRIVKRDRKKTFVEEALVLEQTNKRFEKRYREIQDNKMSGRKSFYKNLQSKRKGRGQRH